MLLSAGGQNTVPGIEAMPSVLARVLRGAQKMS